MYTLIIIFTLSKINSPSRSWLTVEGIDSYSLFWYISTDIKMYKVRYWYQYIQLDIPAPIWVKLFEVFDQPFKDDWSVHRRGSQ